MNNTTDQVEQFLQITQEVPLPQTQVEGEEQPKIPFPTDYVLTAVQEQNLVDHAMRRLDELSAELGRGETEGDWYSSGGENLENRMRTFLGKRQLFEMTYHNKVAWRSHLLGGIFSKSNLVVPLARRICRQMIARANNYFFGTDPWFAAYPVGQQDEVLADELDNYLKFKHEQSKLKPTLEMANELAFVRGETVVKTSHQIRDQIFKQTKSVLVDEAGKDILDAGGDYIFEDDQWVAAQPVEAAQITPEGEEVPQEATLMVLKKDGATPMGC